MCQRSAVSFQDIESQAVWCTWMSSIFVECIVSRNRKVLRGAHLCVPGTLSHARCRAHICVCGTVPLGASGYADARDIVRGAHGPRRVVAHRRRIRTTGWGSGDEVAWKREKELERAGIPSQTPELLLSKGFY